MSGLSALASYDVSDDEEEVDGNNQVSPQESKESVEIRSNIVQSKDSKAVENTEVDKIAIEDEDIWKDSEDEDLDKKEVNEDSKEQSGSDSNDKEKNESVNIDDLSAVYDDSEHEQSGEESAGSEGEGDIVGGLVDAMKVTVKRINKRRSSENATNLAKKLRSASVDEVTIPSEPEGRCSSGLQEKIIRFMERKVKDGEDLNRAIQARKDFRNPSIYEKLIVYLRIDELGTNFPKEDYNPKTWRKAPAYDELARAQREDMAKRERERKTKVEFVTGTVKKSASSASAQNSSAFEAIKKSKWDQQSSNKSGNSDKGSGHKPTVISALGSIKKPKV